MLEVGSEVKIVRKVHHDNWGDAWTPCMDRFAGNGEVYKVTNVLTSLKVHLNCGYNWPVEALEDVNEPGLFD